MVRRSRVARPAPALRLAVAAMLALAGVVAARDAAAADEKPELGVSADEVDADARMGELVLRGNVVVTYERFRLTSPRLALRRTARGIEVNGPGEVVFCPCPSPPVSIAFAGGLVGPPADLVLYHPELRLGGVTLFGLPWFWLRAPSRAGVLPPSVAWRARDGLLIGGGVHLPWRNGEGFDEVDLTAAAYVKGGVELSARVRTARSTNRVRWDHLEGDLVAVDAHGASGGEQRGATLAWDIDASRGTRARSATLQLAEASLPYDRAAGETSLRLGDAAVLGVGVRAMSPRGGYVPGEQSVWGPRLTISGGGALGHAGAWDAALFGASFADGDSAPTHLARTQAGVTMTARASALAARLDLRESTTLAAMGEASAWGGVASARGELSMPLARAYPANGDEGDAPLVHTIEPRLGAGVIGARATGGAFREAGGPFFPYVVANGRTAVASVGGRTTWGRLLGHSGASVEGDIGAAAPITDERLEPWPLARVRAAWSHRLWALSVDGAEALRAAQGHAWIAKTRVGEQQGWHLAVHVAGRRGVDPLLARALWAGTGGEPSGGFLATEGWSGGAEVGARFGGSVTAKAAVDEDFATRTLLQVRGAVGYAHPCRCVAVDAYAGRRLGRDGVDVWVSIDLAPR